MDCKLILKNDKPILLTERGETPFYAYVTYFTENANYEDFAASGYHLYSVCCNFTSLSINPYTGFTAARTGIFDTKGKPDYSEFDADVADLLKKDPEAIFFPRIYLSMPTWWIHENPSEILATEDESGGREMLCSKKYLEDCSEMLREFLAHVRESDYAEAVIGYQVSGGMTQEWVHFDHKGLCANAFPYFCRYMEKEYGRPAEEFDIELFLKDGYQKEYTRFANDSVAEAVEHFSAVCKEECEGKQIVGAFYGYTLELNTRRCSGTFSLNKLIDSKNIDFFCSPYGYSNVRPLGEDLSYMTPYASLRLHGKAYVLEADIRTYLSRYPDECRKDIKIRVNYRGEGWLGDRTVEGTVYQLRRTSAKTLTGTGGMWWFDMWGGWYASEPIQAELSAQRQLCNEPNTEALPSKTRIAILLEERLGEEEGLVYDRNYQQELCRLSYTSGIVSELYRIEDIDRIRDLHEIFLFPQPDPNRQLIAELQALGKLCLYGTSITVEDIRAAYQSIGLTPLAEPGDLIYEGNGFLALHAATAGEKTVTLPSGYALSPLRSGKLDREENSFRFSIDEHDTYLFRIQKK